jgi:hypothetical protein
MKRPLLRRSWIAAHRRASRTAALCAAAWLAGGCADLARLVTPDGSADVRPARVAFTAAVSASTARSADDIVSLRVTSSYLLANGTKAVIGSQTIELTSAVSQAVPIPVELASCLADANRDGGAAGTPCAVILDLALAVNSVVVDRQTVGPLRLAPGATTSVSEPVALFDITSVEFSSTAPIALTIGGSATVSPIIRDSRGSVVGGRVVTFTSSAPTIASVDQSGRITALGAGNARITATLGAIASSVSVDVARAPLSLTIGANAGSGTGTVRSTPAGIDCRVAGSVTSGTCTFAFAADASVTLTSTADAGQVFAAWGGACVAAAVGPNCSITMSQTQTASARFTAMRAVVITSSGTDGRGRVTGAFGLDCRVDGATTSGVCSANVPDGTAVLLTSEADGATQTRVEQRFGGWGADCASSSGASCTVTPAGRNASVGAGFLDGRSLTLTLEGDGGGRMSATNISCARNQGETPRSCASTLPHGTVVRLTQQANAGSTFASWTGACVGQGTTCDVTMTQARSVTATFNQQTALLTVLHTGGGTGSILANGTELCARSNGAAGGVACYRDFPLGTSVTLTVRPGAQTDFGGFSGDCASQTSCAVIMTAPRSVTVTFASSALVTLRVGEIGGGSGTIVSSEATPRINCRIERGIPVDPNGCSTEVPIGTTLALIGTGAASNALYEWGGACSGVNAHRCELTVNTSAQVTTIFGSAIDVEMRVSGTGAGTITFAPLAVPTQAPCQLAALGTPVTCKYSLPTGSSGVFRGFAATGSQFGGIAGPCAESVAGEAVPACTYRGVGFLRVFTTTFTRP